MEFASTNFILIFFPILLGLFYVICLIIENRNIKAMILKILLLLASLVFYGLAGIKGLIVFIICILINYLFGLGFRGKKKTGGKKFLLFISILVNILWLAFYKYFGLLSTSLLKGTFLDGPAIKIILPLGFSFIIFTQIAYLVDCYRGDIEPEKNIIDYALYSAFFIKIAQGPITRYADLGTQIKISFVDNINRISFAKGIKRFAYGLGKKVIIANTLGTVVDKIWTAHESGQVLGSPVAWFGIILYTLQIYYDFSGYSDMAIGLGHMFGFNIPENFDYPYTSFSIKEFWRRWHQSLSFWFRDYLFIPLGGSRKGLARNLLNLAIVFIVTGMWHGADLTFIIWGGVYAFFSIIEKLFLGKALKRNPLKIFNLLYTIIIVTLNWVFFRSSNLTSALGFFKNMFSFSDEGSMLSIASYLTVDLIFAIVIGILFCGALQRPFKKIYLKIQKLNIVQIIDVIFQIAIIVWSILMIIQGSYSPSIYGRF